MSKVVIVLMTLVLAAESCTGAEYSQVWFNYHQVELGPDPDWDSVVTIRNDTLFVAGECLYEVADADTNGALSEWQRLSLAMGSSLGQERDNAVRSAKAKAWLQQSAAHLLIGDIAVLHPGVLRINLRGTGVTKIDVQYYEPVEQDPREFLRQTHKNLVQVLHEGSWLVFDRGHMKIISSGNVEKTIRQLDRIRAGADDAALDLAGTGIDKKWLRALRKE